MSAIHATHNRRLNTVLQDRPSHPLSNHIRVLQFLLRLALPTLVNPATFPRALQMLRPNRNALSVSPLRLTTRLEPRTSLPQSSTSPPKPFQRQARLAQT